MGEVVADTVEVGDTVEVVGDSIVATVAGTDIELTFLRLFIIGFILRFREDDASC